MPRHRVLRPTNHREPTEPPVPRQEEAVMASNVTVMITGHLAENPEPRVTNTGRLVTNFAVISNDRRYDRDRNEWVDAAKTIIRIN